MTTVQDLAQWDLLFLLGLMTSMHIEGKALKISPVCLMAKECFWSYVKTCHAHRAPLSLHVGEHGEERVGKGGGDFS